jgi:hypothetical protein
VQELAPIATLVVATVALYVGLRTIRQRDLADRRDQWWKRFVWAHELTVGDDPASKELGLDVLGLLGSSRLAGREEIEILDAGLTAALVRRAELLDDGWAGVDDGEDVDDGGERHDRA